MDCDNDHSDNPKDWITPEKYEELFPDVSYIIVPSRNDGKVKGNKSARLRHHIHTHSFRFAQGTKRYENVSLSLFFIYNSYCRELGILQITGG